MKIKCKNYRSGMLHLFAHAKYDGIFARVTDSAVFTSHPTNITNKATRAVPLAPRDCVILGELYVPGQPASQVKSHLASGQGELRFAAFAIETWTADMPLGFVQMECESLGFDFAPWKWCDESLQPHEYFPEHEGVVFKDGNMLNWTKWKTVQTADLLVTAVTDGCGKYDGLVGALVCALRTGQVVANVSGMTDEERVEFSLRPPIGQIVEVAYQYVGAGGRLRHPRFVRVRDDKERADDKLQ